MFVSGLAYSIRQYPRSSAPFVAWSTDTGTQFLPIGENGVPAWAYSSNPVDTPSDAQSTFVEHTDCMSYFLLSQPDLIITFSRFLWLELC